MKTQEAVLKWCVTFGLLFVFLWALTPQALGGYSVRAPWVNETGPLSGFTIAPEIALQPTPSGIPPDYEFQFNTALNPTSGLFGRYATQSDLLLGTNFAFDPNVPRALKFQLESTWNSDSQFGFTLGAFKQMELNSTLLGEIGAAVSYTPLTERTTIPLSATLTLSPQKSSFNYGIAIRGELAPADSASWFAIEVQASYQTESRLRLELDYLEPLTQNSPNALVFGVTIPLGASNPLNKSNPTYTLDAPVISLNDEMFLIKIGKGFRDKIENGQIFDIYSEENLIARARVVSVKIDEAALTVIEYKQEKWIEIGCTARRLGE